MPTSALPVASAGAVSVPDPDAQNAYIPVNTFTTTCEYLALPSTCEARIFPSQINAIVSEMLALSEAFNPTGSWNCASLQNMKTNFNAWNSANNATLTNYGARLTVLEGGGISGIRIAYCNGIKHSQTFVSGSTVTVTDWDTMATPNGGVTYNTGNGRFTITEDGVWTISAFINIAQQVIFEKLSVAKNGNNVMSQTGRSEANQNRSEGVSVTLPLVAGDYIEIVLNCTTQGGAVTYTFSEGRMCMAKIGKLTA